MTQIQKKTQTCIPTCL